SGKNASASKPHDWDIRHLQLAGFSVRSGTHECDVSGYPAGPRFWTFGGRRFRQLRCQRPCVRPAGRPCRGTALTHFSTGSAVTEKSAKCYKTSVLRELMWSGWSLFHRLIHIFCESGSRPLRDVSTRPLLAGNPQIASPRI